MRREISAMLIVNLLIAIAFSGCIGEINKREKIGEVEISDFHEKIKNAPFLSFVGYKNPQPDSLTCFASHLEVHLPSKEGMIYSGVPYAAQIEDFRGGISLGYPLATVSVRVDGEIIEGCTQADGNKYYSKDYEVSFYPHMIKQTIQKEGFNFTTFTTFGEKRVIYVKTIIRNEKENKIKIEPVVEGATSSQTFLEKSGVDLAKNVFKYKTNLTASLSRGSDVSPIVSTVIRPSFSIKKYSTLNLNNDPNKTPFLLGSAKYRLIGSAKTLEPNETYEFEYVVASESDTKDKENELIRISNKVLSKEWKEIEKSAKSWYNEWFKNAPDPPEYLTEEEREYYYGAIWTLRHNLWYPRGKFSYPVLFPSLGWYNSFWLWDSCFHSYAVREFDATTAENQIRQLCERQNQKTGEIYNFYTSLGHKIDPPVSQPPLITWSALAVYNVSKNEEFLEDIYDPLVKFHNWWYGHRDRDKDGLVEYIHVWETGWDSSPRWDVYSGGIGSATHRHPLILIDIEAIDLNCILYKDCLYLAKISKIIGKGDESHWLKEAKKIKDLIEENMWDKETGLYYDINVENDEMMKVKTPACFFPLWAGFVSKERADRMIKNYLLSDEFLTAMPFPTVARGEECYLTDDYWRGNVWLNIDFLMLQALHNYGYDKEADEIARTIISYIPKTPSIVEAYNPENGRASGHTSCFGWSAAMYIEICLQRYKEDVLEVKK
jgi:putative isomerase